VRRGFPRTDDTADLLAVAWYESRPCVHDDDGYRPDHTNRVPSLRVNAVVRPMHHQGVVKDKLRRIEIKAVLVLVETVLVFVPYPTHDTMSV